MDIGRAGGEGGAIVFGSGAGVEVSGLDFRASLKNAATTTRPTTNKGKPVPSSSRPILRSIPERVSGTPVIREMRPFAAEMPSARRQENEKPNFFPIVHCTLPPMRARSQCSPVAAYKLMLRRNVCFVPTSPRRAVRACRDSVLFLRAKQLAAPTGTATTSNGDSARTGTRRSGGTASRSTAGSTDAEKGTSRKAVAEDRGLHLEGRPLE